MNNIKNWEWTSFSFSSLKYFQHQVLEFECVLRFIFPQTEERIVRGAQKRSIKDAKQAEKREKSCVHFLLLSLEFVRREERSSRFRSRNRWLRTTLRRASVWSKRQEKRRKVRKLQEGNGIKGWNLEWITNQFLLSHLCLTSSPKTKRNHCQS